MHCQQLQTAAVHVDVAAVVAQLGWTPCAVTVLVDRPGRVVARVDTDHGAVVVKHDTSRTGVNAEYAANRRLAGAGLPVANVLHHHDGEPAWLVLSWIDGTALTSASSPSAKRHAGALLRRVHALGGSAPYQGVPTWDGWMAGWLNTAMAWWTRHTSPDPDLVKAVWEWFARLRPLLATRGHDLILFDGRPDHIIVDGDHVAGIIDLADVCPGDAAMDLAVIAVTDPDLLVDVLTGYQPTTSEQAAFPELIPFYVFLRRLAAAEFNHTHGAPAVTAHLLALVSDTELPR